MALPSRVEGAARAVVVAWCGEGGTDSLGVDAMTAPVGVSKGEGLVLVVLLGLCAANGGQN